MDQAWAAGLGTVAGAVITAVVAGVVLIMNTKHGHSKENRAEMREEVKDVLDRQEATILRHETALAAMQSLITTTRAEHSDCEDRLAAAEVKNARCMGRVEMLEEAMSFAKIPVRPWSPDGSHHHRPLSEEK